MCGRYSLSTPVDDLREVFQVPPLTFDYEPRYNIVPTQEAPVVAVDRRGPRMGLMRWGLVPPWASGPSVGSRTINARAESLRTKPFFKEAVVARRCLVPADGFYEWVREAAGRVPHWIHDPGGLPMSLAGLWARWDGAGREPLYAFAIITVRPCEIVRSLLHDRMPAIVPARDRAAWLDKSTSPEDALEILRPFEGRLVSHAVATLVNSPDNDVPQCIEPA